MAFSFAVVVGLASCSNSTVPVVNTTDSGNHWENTKVVGIEVGNQAPDFALPTHDGKSLSLKSLRGKVVLMDFWASWCPPCQEGVPALRNLHAKYKDKGFTIMGISFDWEQADWKNYINANGMTWNHVYGGYDFTNGFGPVSKTYNVSGIPQTILLDKYGTIIARGIYGDELDKAIAEATK